jgi:hypothetical protein
MNRVLLWTVLLSVPALALAGEAAPTDADHPALRAVALEAAVFLQPEPEGGMGQLCARESLAPAGPLEGVPELLRLACDFERCNRSCNQRCAPCHGSASCNGHCICDCVCG